MAHQISRRRLLSLIGGTAASTVFARFADAAPSRPNVLFMAIDDLNDWIGCLGGHPDVKTPHLDALAARGVLFSNAHCAAPACNPSRAALMTGIRPSTSGVYINSQPWRKSPVLRDAVTIPQHFMAHGYEAIGSGKIYHGNFPDPPSWQEYWPSQKNNKPGDPVRKEKSPAAKTHFDWGPLDVPVEQMGDWQVADWVIGQLGKQHEKPFFLGCGFFRPHLPWYVPRKYFEMYPPDKITLPNVKEDDLDDVPPAGKRMALKSGDHARVLEHNEWRQAVQGYLACISFVDDCVGRVISALDNSPHRDNTLVVLWSDHGWHLGEKLHWRKFALWEEATHNVLMVAAPGTTSPGGRCPATVNLLDIYPTLIELCSLDPKKELEGNSLLPLLKDPQATWDRPTLTTHERNNHSVRSDRWRYIRYADGSEELYDHSADEMEWTNLATDPQYDHIKKELQKWLPSTNAEDVPPK
ncbi:MAG TPA: sulfatase [Candidatus Bathyarchaeia archaeon]|nr:sulfatase [Candidatus Bathyarchaeia archaeon]